MSIIIVNGKIVNADQITEAEIGIQNEKIVEIGNNLNRKNYSTIIDAKGNYIMPGFIDPHVHIKLPMRGTFSHDDFDSATKAAACGGVTTIIDFATQMGEQSLIEAINLRREEADGRVFIDYALHGGITNWKLIKPEIAQIIDDGISSFKMFMAYKERGLYSPDSDIKAAIAHIKNMKGMILLHAEAEEVLSPLMEIYDTPDKKKELGIKAHLLSRPPETEYVAIETAIKLAEQSGGHIYIVHMSTGQGANYVRDARAKGINVVGETCPQYLLFSEEVFEQPNGHWFATAPQIKTEGDRTRLWEAIINKDVQIIGTDSVVFTKEQKDSWNNDFTQIPLGLAGTELMASLLYSEGVVKNKFPVTQFVSLLSTNAAKTFGLFPRKGIIAVGSDADLVIFDPDKEKTVDYEDLQTDMDWNPYQDMKLKGFPVSTMLRGTVIAKDGRPIVAKPTGIFLKRQGSGNFL